MFLENAVNVKSFWIQILMLNKNKLVIEITTTPLSNNILPFVGA